MTGNNQLPRLAVRINSAHAKADAAIETGLDHALACGKHLCEAKELVRKTNGHGSWLEWIDRNCRFGRRTAQGYMRLYKYRAKLPPKAHPDSFLRQRTAFALLADAMLLWDGRIRFIHRDKGQGVSPSFGSSLFYYGPNVERFERHFGSVGTIWFRKRGKAGPASQTILGHTKPVSGLNASPSGAKLLENILDLETQCFVSRSPCA